jgi:hypothetical protein
MSIVLAMASPDSTKLLYALFTTMVTGTVTLAVVVIKNWCRLLSGTYAVMHRDQQRRADARLVYERSLDKQVERHDDAPETESLPMDQRLPDRWRRRRRKRRRHR